MTRTHNTIATITITVCASILYLSCGKPTADGGSATTPTADGGTGTDTDTGGTTSPTGTNIDTWTKEDFKACRAADADGYSGATGVMSDCECVEEEVYDTWSLDDYKTDIEKTCYIEGWGESFSQWCTETCWVKGPIDKCCMNMTAWAVDQYP